MPQKALEGWVLSTALTTTHHHLRNLQHQLCLYISQRNSSLLEIRFKSLLQRMMESSPVSRLPILKLLSDEFMYLKAIKITKGESYS